MKKSESIRNFWLKKRDFILIFIATSNLISVVIADLRFCNKGPHIIRDADCPGGFISKNPIEVTCAHYAISDKVPDGSVPTVVEDYCVATTPIDLPLDGGDVSVKMLQEFYINVVDPAASPAKAANFTPPDVCEESCMAEWRDPDEIEPEDHLNDKPKVENPDVSEEEERDLTKTIFMNLLMDDNFEEDDPFGFIPIYDPLFYEANSTEQRVIRLMAKSMQIVLNQCNPYIEENFLRQVLKAIIFLTNLNKPGMVDIGIEEYKQIDGYLDKCLNNPNIAFKLKGSQCDTYNKVEAIEYMKSGTVWKYRSQARSFIWGMYDPIVEAAWAVTDFVHGYCFASFTTNLNHHHMYQIGMEGLFPIEPMQRHWLTPTILSKGDQFWNSVLETGDIKVAMRNLDACAIAGYAVSPFRHRLERTFTPEEMLETQTFTKIPMASAAGWTKGAQQYWSYYEARGGFKGRAKEWGTCLGANADSWAKTKTVQAVQVKNCNMTFTTTEAPVPGPPGPTGPPGTDVEAAADETAEDLG